MITSLRNKGRVDNLQSESRGSRGTIGRWVYLLLVTLLLIWLLDTLFGKYFFFRADGMVMRDIRNVSVSYTATVEEFALDVGDYVAAGAQIAKLNSTDILQRLAELSIKSAEVKSRIAELQAREKQLAKILPLARQRVGKMVKLRETEEKAAARGLVDTRRISQYLEDEFDSLLNYEKLLSESLNINSQIQTLAEIDQSLQENISRISEAYGDGALKAPADVTVSQVFVNTGSVVKNGEPLVELLSGGAYILAYVTPGAVNIAKTGDEVSLKYGLKTLRGKIQQIFPISARLPLEFQRTFRPQERSQMMRVEILSKEDIPATFTKIKIIAPGLIPIWLSDLFG